MESKHSGNDNFEKLKSGLYSRERERLSAMVGRRRPLRNQFYGGSGDWSHEEEKKAENKPVFSEPKKRISFALKILIASVIFFVISSAVAFYRFYFGSNIISANNIEISVTGPVSVSGGEKISLDVNVYNKNKIDLKSADLRIEYPEGARAPEDLKTEFKRSIDALGDIPQGGNASKRVEVILFGEEKSKKEIKVTVEYRISGSSAVFYKEKIYEVVISDSPVNIEVSGLKEINANQAVDFAITVASNSSGPIKNLLLKAEYPFGFAFADSSEKPIGPNNDIWLIGDLSPGQKKTVKIYGKLGGQDGEDKILRFTAGIASDTDERAIATALVTSLASISIKKPFIGIELSFDGNTDNNFVFQSSKLIRANILWKNNLATPVNDAEIQIKFQGNALNKSSVSIERGFYRSVDNTIVVNKTDDPSLESVGPGQSGNINFSFGSLNSYTGSSEPIKEGVISLDIIASGKRIQGGNVPQEVLYSATKNVKIATDLKLSSRIIHWSGPFQNKGPMPPKAEKETTYTIIWTVINTSNKVKDGKVVATLPVYVKWASKISPENEDVSFNPASSEIVWNIGDVEASAGIGSKPREVAFQVSFLPSVSQVGQSPIILNDSVLSGTDSFTSTSVGETRSSLSTTLNTDPDFKYSEDKVAQ